MAFYVCKQCGAETPTWSGACASCGSKEHVALVGQTSREGQTVAGRYKLIKRLGEGGMGAVYLAEQVGVGNQLALKFLKPELSHNEALARRFLAEARTYIRVAHPGAVQLTDYGQDETGGHPVTIKVPQATQQAFDYLTSFGTVVDDVHP